jgi:capsular polysaccharide biosynthesis protein
MINIDNLKLYKSFLTKDENGRYINIYHYYDLQAVCDLYYPNVIFKNQDNIINPLKEKIMSLQIDFENNNIKNLEVKNIYETPLFFFIYNTDNYYHFIYDTLPYLISFFELKKEIKELKLLMSYPNFQKKEFYKFVKEFLEILEITDEDIIIIDKNTLYKEIYFSNSYTHDIDSNLPPREEIYDFYQSIVEKVSQKYKTDKAMPKKIYISRRSWLHGDTSNIGTNYTNRRKLECEDELVEYLNSIGYEEIFTENLSTFEKILLFNNVECVVGAIGGGLCNVLFSKPECKLISLCSPTFLDINNRFKYSFSKIQTIYYTDTFHTEKDFYKKSMRVKCDNIVGEIEEVKKDTLIVAYVDAKVAGWNSNMIYKKIEVKKEDSITLDNGLNSSWNLDLEILKKLF